MTEISLGNRVYISSYTAARDADITVDHVTRLARANKFKAKKIGGSWFVDRDSFFDYILLQKYYEFEAKNELSLARKREYRVSGKPTPLKNHGPQPSLRSVLRRTSGQLRAARTHKIDETLYNITPMLEVLHRIAALIASIIIVFGLYGVLDNQFRDFTVSNIADNANNLNNFALRAITSIEELSRTATNA